jgi:hypothetical protein
MPGQLPFSTIDNGFWRLLRGNASIDNLLCQPTQPPASDGAMKACICVLAQGCNLEYPALGEEAMALHAVF